MPDIAKKYLLFPMKSKFHVDVALAGAEHRRAAQELASGPSCRAPPA